MSVDIDLGARPVLNIVGSAIGAFVTTLVVGAILRAVVPDYTDRLMATVLEKPAGSFVSGIIWLVFLGLVTIVLVITIVGILVAIPLVILSYLEWAVGASIAFLAIGDRLVGHEDGWTKPLLVGAAINAGLTLTGIGGIITFGIGAEGFGAVIDDYR